MTAGLTDKSELKKLLQERVVRENEVQKLEEYILTSNSVGHQLSKLQVKQSLFKENVYTNDSEESKPLMPNHYSGHKKRS
jgi:hypothetical protein